MNKISWEIVGEKSFVLRTGDGGLLALPDRGKQS